jgi:hypothetical protein
MTLNLSIMSKLFLAAILSCCTLAGMSQSGYVGTTAERYLAGRVIDFSNTNGLINEETDLYFFNDNPVATPVYSEMGVWGEDRVTGDFVWFVDMKGTGELMSNNYTFDISTLSELHYTWDVTYSDGTWEADSVDYYFY